MGQQSEAHQDIDRAIGKWKYDLLDECSELVLEDIAEHKQQLSATIEELQALQAEAEKTTQKADDAYTKAVKARHVLDEKYKKYNEGLLFWFTGLCFLSSLFGSFITFLLLWYFW